MRHYMPMTQMRTGGIDKSQSSEALDYKHETLSQQRRQVCSVKRVKTSSSILDVVNLGYLTL